MIGATAMVFAPSVAVAGFENVEASPRGEGVDLGAHPGHLTEFGTVYPGVGPQIREFDNGTGQRGTVKVNASSTGSIHDAAGQKHSTGVCAVHYGVGQIDLSE